MPCTVSFKLAFNFIRDGVVETSIGCLVDSIGGSTIRERGDLKAVLIHRPTDEECGLLPEGNLSVTMNLTSLLSDYQIRCDYYNRLISKGDGDFASELLMPEIKGNFQSNTSPPHCCFLVFLPIKNKIMIRH